MRDIYSAATKVTAWIGEEDESSDEAIALMQELGMLVPLQGKIDPLLDLGLGLLTPEHFQKIDFDLSTKNWAALWQLWRRPYWSTIWVVQELSCSEVVLGTDDRYVFRCGNTELSKSDLLGSFLMIAMIIRPSVNFVHPEDTIEEALRTLSLGEFHPARALCNTLILCSSDASAISITNLMQATKDFKSTDCRDKLYAILGLVQSEDMAIIPDYSKSPAQVYEELVRFLINRNRKLTSLCCNRWRTNEFGPSWNPELYGGTMPTVPWMNMYRHYKASGERMAEVSFNAEASLIHAQGVLLGTLSTVIGPFGSTWEESDATQKFGAKEVFKGRKWDVLWEALTEFQQTLDAAQQETFWRTLIMDADYADRTNIKIPAPSEWREILEVVFGDAELPQNFEPGLSKIERVARFSGPWAESVELCCKDRSFFTTADGRMGIGPFGSKPGDVATSLYGGDACFILRPTGEKYELIGDAYVHGVMHGELVEAGEAGQMRDSRTFTLC